jgi:hypothetical protein
MLPVPESFAVYWGYYKYLIYDSGLRSGNVKYPKTIMEINNDQC